MVSRENKVIVAFGALALTLGFGGLLLTSVGGTILTGVILFVGVVVPTAVNEYLDRRAEESA